MPLPCSACGSEVEKECFSAAQLKKKEKRRCKACVASSPEAPVDVSDAAVAAAEPQPPAGAEQKQVTAAAGGTATGTVAKEPESERDPAADSSSSDGEDDEQGGDDSEEISLGFAVECDPTALLRNRFASKLGGPPAWLDPVQLPLESELRCAVSGLHLQFVLQVYAPINDDPRAFHRALYLFVTPQGSELGQPGTVRAFRTQLPRENDFYPFEPPGDADRPRALTAEHAAVAACRCRPFASDPPEAAGWFKEHELAVEPEPGPEEIACGAQAEQLSRLVDAYRDAQSSGGAKPDEVDTSAFGKLDTEVNDFSTFTARLARAPEQCLRYTFGAHDAPLWASRHRRPPAGSVPPCRCGSPRRFECQLMPQALAYMGIDSEDPESPDWATIAIYTCAASCAPTPPLPVAADGSGSLADPADPVAAAAAVGAEVRVDGLQSRPALNGARGRLLDWHAPSARWSVEFEGGEGLRVRSSNLWPTADPAAPREGGYAEEYVWVQTHGDVPT